MRDARKKNFEKIPYDLEKERDYKEQIDNEKDGTLKVILFI